MGKIVDITDKLSFDENPIILIKGQQFEVNADAETVLRIMGAFKNGDNGVDATLKAYELMFSEESREKIADMKMPFKDLIKIIELSMALVQGEENVGETIAPTMI